LDFGNLPFKACAINDGLSSFMQYIFVSTDFGGGTHSKVVKESAYF
jgi:hypothetical protein